MDLIRREEADAVSASARAPHNVKAVAAALGCAPKTVWSYVKRGEWPCTWVGQRIRFTDEQVTEIKALWVRPVQRQAG